MFAPAMESTMDMSQEEDMSMTEEEEDMSSTEDDSSLIEELGLNSAPAEDTTATGTTASGTASSSDDLGGLLGDLLK